MIQPKNKWEFLAPNPQTVSDIAAALDLPEPVARAMANRGITTTDAASQYINPTMDQAHDPFLMRDMETAVNRTIRALDGKERMLVLGDYDVDGITSTALLVSFLKELGGRVNYYIPHRETEGYGLSGEVVKKTHKAGYSLILTVDTGVSALEEAALARELGVDLIIIDHHEPPAELPQANALLNPKRQDSSYPFRDLAGVGVAFKFITALGSRKNFDLETMLDKYSELVALGTIGDLVPLQDENRFLARHGLGCMNNTSNIGLNCLIDVARYNDNDEPDTYLVSFGLAPRINAAGRVWNPRAGVELLLADSEERAAKIARKLDEHNRDRILKESFIVKDALRMLDDCDTLDNDKTILLFSEDWNVGIVGIVASKLLERHYRPVLLTTLSHRPEDEKNPHPEKGRICQGSARSIREIDIHEALTQCDELLLSYGGHAMAAGVKIYEHDIPLLREKLNSIVASQASDGRFHPSLRIDDTLELQQIGLPLLRQTRQMEPCGVGNPKPVFAAKNVTVLESRSCGAEGKHLLMRFGQNSAVCNAIGFNLTARWSAHELIDKNIDIAFTLREDNFRNRRTVKLQLTDLRQAED